MSRRVSRDRKIWKGAVAGAIAGLVASWVMSEFQQKWSKVSQEFQRERPNGRSQKPDSESGQQEQSEDATKKMADRLSQSLFHRNLDRGTKQLAGPVVHYAFGTLTGALYGALAESIPVVTAGRGSGYASALFVFGDEIAVPALGLSGPISESPLSSHIFALCSHLVYGFALENVRRRVRQLIPREEQPRRSRAELFRETPAGARFRKAA